MGLSPQSTSSRSESKRPYYRPTTADQRKVLFRVYERTESPREACAAAHVGIATFYYWRPRFEQGGYAALEEVRSHARHTYARALPVSTVQEVIEAKRGHPEWGRRRIADELRKGHGWQAVVSASEVRRILIEAGLWPQVSKPPKKVSRALAMRKGPTKR